MSTNNNKLRILIPKGRIFEKVNEICKEAGIHFKTNGRKYRPHVNIEYFEAKIMKPQNIAKILELGSHDIGFTGLDWVKESNADIEEIMDLEFDAVKIVAAVPENTSIEELKNKKIIVASEYENLANTYLSDEGYNFILLKSFGATEVFPPDDADMIIDNTSTGRTLKEHKLNIIKTILSSTTRFISNKQAMQDPWKRDQIEKIKMLFQSVLNAKDRIIMEMNVPKENIEQVINILPCMRAPTVAPLYNDLGYSIKIAIKKSEVASIIPELKKYGVTDILEYGVNKVIL